MKLMKRVVLGIGPVMGALMLVMSQNATAVPVMIIDDLNTVGIDLTLFDNDLNDISDVDGLVKFDGAVGGFDVVVSIGLSKPFIGSGEHADLKLLNTTVSGIGDLQIMFTDTDFVLGSGPINKLVTSALSGQTTGPASVAFMEYVDPNNQQFGMAGGGVVSIDHGSYSAAAFSAIAYENVALDGAFSITKVITLSHTGPGAITDVSFTANVPEPGTLALLGIGLAGIGFSRRKTV